MILIIEYWIQSGHGPFETAIHSEDKKKTITMVEIRLRYDVIYSRYARYKIPSSCWWDVNVAYVMGGKTKHGSMTYGWHNSIQCHTYILSHFHVHSTKSVPLSCASKMSWMTSCKQEKHLKARWRTRQWVFFLRSSNESSLALAIL